MAVRHLFFDLIDVETSFATQPHYHAAFALLDVSDIILLFSFAAIQDGAAPLVVNF